MPNFTTPMTIKNFIIDMDGVLWRGETPMPGLADFFATLRRLEMDFVLATNNATKTAVQYTQKLARFGVDVPPEKIVSSSQATAAYLSQRYPAGSPLYVIGEAGLQDALSGAGFTLIDEPGIANPDFRESNGPVPAAVVVGLNKKVCYDQLAAATLLVAAGAGFIGTNPDPSFPSERGQLPGAGALLAVIITATGIQPTIIGKPGQIIFAEALRRLNSRPAETAMIGDRLTTDIAGGHAAGLKTILVLSGIATRADVTTADPKPDWIFDDIAALTAVLNNRQGLSEKLSVKS